MAFPAGAHLWNIGTARMKNINNLHSQTHRLHNSLIQSKASHKSLRQTNDFQNQEWRDEPLFRNFTILQKSNYECHLRHLTS
jgi:hypothetical protein